LQSPKGPQRIASIVRIYPAFDAPVRQASNGRVKRGAAAATRDPQRGLPTIDEMENLIARIREVEREVVAALVSETDQRIDELKRSLADLSGDALEHAYRELGAALESKRALASQARHEARRRVEADTEFAPRTHLRLLAR